MVHKVVMQSGRVYEIPDYDEKDYTKNWIYFSDSNGDTIIGLRKDDVEAEVFQDGDQWTQGRVNSN